VLCAAAGCDSPAKSKGYCWMHFGRFRRNGDPLASGKHGGHNKGIGPPVNVPDPAPLQAVRVKLQASRSAGVPFAEAWRDAIAGLDEWSDALEQTRKAWRSAYNLDRTDRQPFDALRLEPKDIRRSGPPVVAFGQRHDGPCELEPLIVPWCN